MNRLFSIFGLVLFLPFLPTGDADVYNLKNEKKKAAIQVALLLDTSNSMDGLIDQAKSQLWKMVNELATTQKNGETPDIEIAIYEYGNDGLSVKSGYVRQVASLTNDLDEISDQLFKLTTNGGSEYCAWAIKDAVKDLTWTNDAGDLRLIVIAGNEPFDQGPITPDEAVKDATGKGICITTIFCGNWDEGANTGWKLKSSRADCEQYLNIDMDQKVAHIPTPYDDRIIALNQALNATYVSYGREGEMKMMNQATQDMNAASYSGASLRERASFKAKKQYNNASWDLVDAAESDEEVIKDLKKEDLPDEMKNMNVEERKAYIEQKRQERENIRKEILDLETKANAFVAEKQKEMAVTQTLDNVMKNSVRELARAKGFE